MYTSSHAQDMKAQVKPWQVSSFVTVGCCIYCFLVMWCFWTHLIVTTAIVWIAAVSNRKENINREREREREYVWQRGAVQV